MLPFILLEFKKSLPMTEHDYITELKKLALEIVKQSTQSNTEIDTVQSEILDSHDWVTWFEDAQKVVNISKSVEDAYLEVKHFSCSYACLVTNLAYECMRLDMQEYIDVYKDIAT